jgi:hypothetical protein
MFPSMAGRSSLAGDWVSDAAVGVTAAGTCTKGWRLTSMPGTYSSTTTWKLVPPKPKAETPQRRGANDGRSHGRALVLTSKGILSNGMAGLSTSQLIDGGRILWWQASTALSRPAAPAALLRWPICDLTEPSAILCLMGVPSMSTLAALSISETSPTRVEVPWPSSKVMVAGSSPARFHARWMAKRWPMGLGAVMPLPRPSLAPPTPRITA